MIRLVINLLTILSVFVFPPYVTALFLSLTIVFFPFYFESVLFALILDVVYGGGKIFGVEFPFIFTSIFLVFFLISFKIKTMLKFYPQKQSII